MISAVHSSFAEPGCLHIILRMSGIELGVTVKMPGSAFFLGSGLRIVYVL